MEIRTPSPEMEIRTPSPEIHTPSPEIVNPSPPETVIHIPTGTQSPRPHRLVRVITAMPTRLAFSVAIGLVVYLAIPKPTEVSKQAWRLFAIFLTTVAGLILGPLPVGAWTFICLMITVITKTLTVKNALSGFTNDIVWLIVLSFFFSRGFVKTGYFVKWLGKSTLGLAYGLAIGEAIISLAMSSSTARAGGIFLPVINSLAIASGSSPHDGSARKLGAYLIQSQLQVRGIFQFEFNNIRIIKSPRDCPIYCWN
ncbi:putative solute carrier family 13 [Helianthus annuus]|uniref:Putative sodium/sulfate symporter n=1 Tax=Helianthus annuus TaxID=4232 RepID=A0A251S5X8_HELAN|nr:putative solute carrier family 13 [Helianthus annuus]KAJ0471882.1 putative solute carrier family 13 [Helianthus annuus]KAJ0647485.1 putative solute carrier family 13 [Helianthus annuus]KAJ0651363.1 putative solute carrier family 13 [Helianthus annuus]KAJ0829936.1 putative solute carrier family 13 [Helianthus annuus]